MMKYFSPCDGIGAIHVAAQRLGWKCVGVSETAPFPAAVVDHHYRLRNLGDMTRFLEWPEALLADIDLLVGGTPCPSYSAAGKRRGLDDDRGILLLVFADLYRHINTIRRKYGRPPAVAIFENVTGILTSEDNAFGHFVGRLLGCHKPPQTKAKDGEWAKAGLLDSETARVGWRVLDSQHFAIAQRRKRVFLVAVPRELIEHYGERACPARILKLRCSGEMKPLDLQSARGITQAEWIAEPSESVGGSSMLDLPWLAGVRGGFSLPCRVNLSSILQTGPVHRKYYLGPKKAWRMLRRAEDRGKRLDPLYEQVLTMAMYGTRGIAAELVARAAMKDGDSMALAVDGLNQSISEELHHTLRVGRDSGDAVVVVTATSEVSGTLTAKRGNGFRSDGTPTHGLAIEGDRLRTMTPIEWERLMGFPDGFTAINYRGKPATDSPRYHALGNSIAVPIVSWLCQQVAEAFTVSPLPEPQEPGGN
jgi:DNA (cytosine-5)-methyltransferase 1